MKRLALRLTTGITDSCGAAALNWKLIDLAVSHLLLFFFPSGCFIFKEGGRTVADGLVLHERAQAKRACTSPLVCVFKIFAWRMHQLHLQAPATSCTSYLSLMSCAPHPFPCSTPPRPAFAASKSSHHKQKGRARAAPTQAPTKMDARSHFVQPADCRLSAVTFPADCLLIRFFFVNVSRSRRQSMNSFLIKTLGRPNQSFTRSLCVVYECVSLLLVNHFHAAGRRCLISFSSAVWQVFFFFYFFVTVQKDFLQRTFHVRKSHEAASGTTSEAVVSLGAGSKSLPPPPPTRILQKRKKKSRLSQRPRHSSSPGSPSGVRREDGKKLLLLQEIIISTPEKGTRQ